MDEKFKILCYTLCWEYKETEDLWIVGKSEKYRSQS